jgi:uncharacterized sulfatase
VEYLFETPATRAWHRLFLEGRLPAIQRAYWEPKAPEELYDLARDPFETINLADSRLHRGALVRLRRAHRRHTLAIRDVGLLPEAEMLERAQGQAPGDLWAAGRYEVQRVWEAAELAARRDQDAAPRLKRLSRSPDSAVRYWAAVGLLIRGSEAVAAGREELQRLLGDASPSVRIAAAEALAEHGAGTDVPSGIDTLLAAADVQTNDYLVAVAALNALDHLGDRVGAARARVTHLANLPRDVSGVSPRMNDYLDRLFRSLLDPGKADAR